MVILVQALDRVIHCLKNLERSFSGNKMVSVAYKVAKDVKSSRSFLNYPTRGESGLRKTYTDALASGLDIPNPFCLPTDFQPDFGNGLSNQQINTIMTVFNQYEPLTGEQMVELRPVLGSALRAAVFGVFRVVLHFVRGGGERYVMSQHLERDNYVYVRERWASFED